RLSTMAALWAMGLHSAARKRVWPRWTRPAEIVVARCHARSLGRAGGVRQSVRPRAISIPHRQETMGLLATCQSRETLFFTSQDTIVGYEKSIIFLGKNLLKLALPSIEPHREGQQHAGYRKTHIPSDSYAITDSEWTHHSRSGSAFSSERRAALGYT